jgi:hypothetical protein
MTNAKSSATPSSPVPCDARRHPSRRLRSVGRTGWRCSDVQLRLDSDRNGAQAPVGQRTIVCPDAFLWADRLRDPNFSPETC